MAEIELHSVSNVKSKSSLTVIKHSSTAPLTGRTLHSYSESAPLLLSVIVISLLVTDIVQNLFSDAAQEVSMS